MGKTPEQPNPLDDPAHARSTYQIMREIFDRWGLSDDHCSILLGVSQSAWGAIQSEEILPPLMPLALRAAELLRIYHMSCDIYPRDPCLAAGWIRRQIFDEPFLGKHPLQFMLMDTTEDGGRELRQTREHLNAWFDRWCGVYNMKGELFYCNDELRLSEEPVDALAHMMLRIQKCWKLSDSIFERMVGSRMPMIRDVATGKCLAPEAIAVKMRLIACIDIALWNNIRDEEKMSTWLLSLNNHELFGGAPPYHLLLSQDPDIAGVVYAYLRNISP